MMRGGSVVVVLALAVAACTSHQHVRLGQRSEIVNDGKLYELESLTRNTEEVLVVDARPDGSFVVQPERGARYVVPFNEATAFRRKSRGMGFLYGFGGALLAGVLLGSLIALDPDTEKPAIGLVIGATIGGSFGLLISGPIGAAVGKDYVYEVTP